MDHATDRAEAPTKLQRARQWFNSRAVALISYALAVALLLVLLWPHIIITINSGEAGVKYSRLFGGTVMNKVYAEGLHLMLPWDTMFIYDTRLQHEDLDIPVLSRGGLTVTMKAAVYYYPIYERLPELHKEIGPEYKEKLILPIITSAIRNTVGSYWPEDLYTSAPLKLQDEIIVQAVEQMARKPVIIDSVVVGGISLPQQVNEAIDLKFSAEQEYLRYKYVLLKAGEQLKERYIQAESIRLFQETVNKGLTENFLRWSGIEATKELAASQNSKFVIVGGRDGLPLILNTDTGSEKAKGKAPLPSLDTGTVPSHPARKMSPGAREQSTPDWSAFTERFQQIENTLKKFNPLGAQNAAEQGKSPDLPAGEEK